MQPQGWLFSKHQQHLEKGLTCFVSANPLSLLTMNNSYTGIYWPDKLVVIEWWQWLEGAMHHFIIYTDHKNSKFIQTANRLNPWQSRWALFFFCQIPLYLALLTWFKEYQSWCPVTPLPFNPSIILSSSCFLNALTWELDKQINSSLTYHMPKGTPVDCTFMPIQLYGYLNTWVHTSLGTRHSSHCVGGPAL